MSEEQSPVGRSAVTPALPDTRIASIDALRGFDMFWIIGGGRMFAALAAVLMAIAIRCKSFKEAQNYISLMLLIPALPALVMAILPVRESLWLVLLPTVGQQLFINQILRAEAVSPANVALSSIVTEKMYIGTVGAPSPERLR